MLPDVDELEQVAVQPRLSAGGPEQGLVGARGACSHHDSIQAVFADASLEGRQTRLRATVQVVLGVGHVR
ncbi:MAG: hypothetical protein A2Z37_18800 [Chloroflexi bacterium RBG_19FT_COMBO_62_14]|nr:MAG: hypothetical protein A2Z37_18800 [Chloroflexi bacterium RBG_19FT_COMBO_62_14]